MTGSEAPGIRHASAAELEAGLAHVAASPTERGTVALIVARPRENERRVLERGRLDPGVGLEGDCWHLNARSTVAEQLTLMNSRVIALVARERARWPLAGDQLYVDFDLGAENAPPGTRLTVGTAVIEVSDVPHTGCAKFRDRFGRDALRFVNSAAGRRRGLRGINAFVVTAGTVAVGDAITRAGGPD